MQQLQQIEPLQQIPRLKYNYTSNTRECRKYSSDLDLLYLSSKLNYQAHLILTNQEKCKKDLCINDYIKKSLELMHISKNYQNSSIDINMRDYKKIIKEYNLKIDK